MIDVYGSKILRISEMNNFPTDTIFHIFLKHKHKTISQYESEWDQGSIWYNTNIILTTIFMFVNGNGSL